MSLRGTVTIAIEKLKKGGDSEAAKEIWDRYFHRVVGLAQKFLDSRIKIADKEDVAISVLGTLCFGAANGKFQDLDNSTDLWLLLFVLTKRKATGYFRYEIQGKRDFRRTFHESSLVVKLENGVEEDFFDCFLGYEPTPEFLELAEEEFQTLLNKLGDTILKDIAVKKMEGYTDGEIAEMHGVSRRTIQRKLETIKETWLSELPDGSF